jgi:CheY-like chemotaxis protein
MQTVLLIDDEFGIVEALCALLADEGYRTVSAANGRQGLAKLEKAQPDLILLDFMMPELDGAGFLRQLRLQAIWRTVPVVMMSSVSEEMVRDVCGNAFEGFLHKPFSVSQLLDLVAKLLPGTAIGRRPTAILPIRATSSRESAPKKKRRRPRQPV